MNATATIATKPTREEIASLAYQLWEKSGRRPDCDVDNWLQAEKQLADAGSRSSSTAASSESTHKLVIRDKNKTANHLRRATDGLHQTEPARF